MLSNTLLALIIGPWETQQWVASVLMAAGFTVLRAIDIVQGIQLATKDQPDIAIADEVVLGSMSTSLLHTLKRKIDVPILVTGSGSDDAVLVAVQQGADSYVSHLTESKEFLARIHSLLRRHLLVKVSDRLTSQYHPHTS